MIRIRGANAQNKGYCLVVLAGHSGQYLRRQQRPVHMAPLPRPGENDVGRSCASMRAGNLSPGADVAGVSPVPVQIWMG